MTMCKTYAAKRLLEHGPLSMAQFKVITGWTQKHAYNTIKALLMTGAVESTSLRSGINLYALASSPSAAKCTSANQSTPKPLTRTTGMLCHG